MRGFLAVFIIVLVIVFGVIITGIVVVSVKVQKDGVKGIVEDIWYGEERGTE